MVTQVGDAVPADPPRLRHMAVVAMPDWPVDEPLHGLAAVAGIARAAGWTARAHDLGSALRHHFPEARRARDWFGDVDAYAEGLWNRHGAWITARLDAILAEQPDVVGFSVNLGTRHLSLTAGRYIKARAPNILVMFGGPSCFPDFEDSLFPDGPWHEACDVVCRGEAELALRAFLTGYDHSRVPTVAGFLYRRDGVSVDTGPAANVDMKRDVCRAAFDGLKPEHYPLPGSLPFQLSRGCPYRCRFCSGVTLFPRYRVRDAGEAFAEVEAMEALARARGGRLHLAMSDSIFNANVGEMRRFLDRVIDSGLSLGWRAMVHIHPAMTADLLATLRRSGCLCLFWGIESGSQAVIDAMGKQYRLSDARRIITDCSRLGIAQQLPILIGYPGETTADIVDSIRFILEFRHYPKVTLFQPSTVKMYPNSAIGRDLSAHRRTGPTPDDWETADGRNTPATRRLRAFVARNARGNDTLTRDALADAGGWERLDLTDVRVAGEYWDLVDGLFRSAGRDDWRATAPPGVRDRAAWMVLDRAAPAVREMAVEVVLDALRHLQDAVFRLVEAAADAPPLLRPPTDDGRPAAPAPIRGWLDRAEPEGDDVVVAGWAFDPARPGGAVDIVVHSEGRLVCRSRTGLRRGDVAADHGPAAALAGFEFRIPHRSLGEWTTLFVMTEDGRYGRLGFNSWTVTAF